MTRITLFDSPVSDWKKVQTECLQACRQALDAGDQAVFKTIFNDLFQKYSKTVPLSEWVSFFKEIHALCEPCVAVQPTDPTAMIHVDSQPKLPSAWLSALPPITPFQWRMTRCENASEFESKISSHTTLLNHHLYYWRDSQQIHLCYFNDKGRRHDWNEQTLLTEAAKLENYDPQVVNALRLVSLQDDLKENHSAFSPELMTSLLTVLKQKRYLFIPVDEKSTAITERRIIRQINSQETIYYGEWFNVPSSAESALLPGLWTTVYPLSPGEMKQPQSEGWVQLDRSQHAELWSLLEQQDREQRQQRSYQAACTLYATIDAQLSAEEFSAQLASAWHFTTAESAADQQRWFYSASESASAYHPPAAIPSGCQALAVLEQEIKPMYPLN